MINFKKSRDICPNTDYYYELFTLAAMIFVAVCGRIKVVIIAGARCGS
jgi:hypothetical protein